MYFYFLYRTLTTRGQRWFERTIERYTTLPKKGWEMADAA